jgi:hypothetical protein
MAKINKKAVGKGLLGLVLIEVPLAIITFFLTASVSSTLEILLAILVSAVLLYFIVRDWSKLKSTLVPIGAITGTIGGILTAAILYRSPMDKVVSGLIGGGWIFHIPIAVAAMIYLERKGGKKIIAKIWEASTAGFIYLMVFGMWLTPTEGPWVALKISGKLCLSVILPAIIICLGVSLISRVLPTTKSTPSASAAQS